MSINIARPDSNEYAPFYHAYIDKVNADDILDALAKGRDELMAFFRSIPVAKLDYRYQEGKWTPKEILVHHMDVERIFAYRALRFSRNDSTPLPGFDEDQYIAVLNAPERTLPDLLSEYSALRNSSIEFFKNINSEISQRTGIANGKEISVRALVYIIRGHEVHHMNVIKERYL